MSKYCGDILELKTEGHTSPCSHFEFKNSRVQDCSQVRREFMALSHHHLQLAVAVGLIMWMCRTGALLPLNIISVQDVEWMIVRELQWLCLGPVVSAWRSGVMHIIEARSGFLW